MGKEQTESDERTIERMEEEEEKLRCSRWDGKGEKCKGGQQKIIHNTWYSYLNRDSITMVKPVCTVLYSTSLPYHTIGVFFSSILFGS